MKLLAKESEIKTRDTHQHMEHLTHSLKKKTQKT